MTNKAKNRLTSQQSSDNKDRISVLPVHIMHNILSLLPTNEAMLTTVLSRAWRDVWINLPNLSLDEPLFCQTLQSFGALRRGQRIIMLEFFNLIDRTLRKRWKQSNTNMASLSLYVPPLCLHTELSICVDRWINLAINYFKVEELIINNGSEPRPPLYKFVIETYVPTLPLKRLELHQVALAPDIIECLSRHCPLMERLCFYNCNKLDKPSYKVSGFPKLVEFVLHYRNRTTNYDWSELESEIDAPNLRLLAYTISLRSKIKADTSVNLKDLWLCRVNLTSNWHLSLLSKLELARCYFDTEDVVISSNYLKTLSMWNCTYSLSFKLKIEAPTLEYFNFSGPLPRSFELNHCGLEKAIYRKSTNTSRAELVDSLPKINPCKELKIEDYFTRYIIIEPEWRSNCDSPVPDVKHLELRLRDNDLATPEIASLRLSCFVDTLLWLSPRPSKITISFHGTNDQEFKVLKLKYYDEGKNGVDICNKCEYFPVRCWQLHLEEVSIENHRADGNVLACETRKQKRDKDDDNIKAFFENMREKEKIVVNIIT